jgi:hypothetical protein
MPFSIPSQIIMIFNSHDGHTEKYEEAEEALEHLIYC